MSILLTGSSGFIGRSLYVKNPELFRCVIRNKLNPLEKYSLLNDGCFFIEEFNSSTIWDGAFENINSIVHLAGLAHSKSYREEEYREINLLGTLNFARSAANNGVNRFVFVSSILVNGCFSAEKSFSCDQPPNPNGFFANSKFDAEQGLKEISYETGLEIVIVRPTLVYGPNAPGNFDLLTKLVKKLPVLPFGQVNSKRDFIAVQNLADLLIACATHPNAAGHTFLASDMETVSIKQFTNAIAEGVGKKVIQLPIPVSLMRLAGKLMGKSTMVEQLVGSLQVDSSNIKEVLNWTPPLTMKQAMATLRDSGKSSSGK